MRLSTIYSNEVKISDIVLEDKYSKIERVYSLLKEKNPEILKLENSIDKNKEGLKLAKRGFLPDFTIGV